jgi:hypothetical protein
MRAINEFPKLRQERHRLDDVAPSGAEVIRGWFLYKDSAPDGAGITTAVWWPLFTFRHF